MTIMLVLFLFSFLSIFINNVLSSLAKKSSKRRHHSTGTEGHRDNKRRHIHTSHNLARAGNQILDSFLVNQVECLGLPPHT